jgi:hypothetical protein
LRWAGNDTDVSTTPSVCCSLTSSTSPSGVSIVVHGHRLLLAPLCPSIQHRVDRQTRRFSDVTLLDIAEPTRTVCIAVDGGAAQVLREDTGRLRAVWDRVSFHVIDLRPMRKTNDDRLGENFLHDTTSAGARHR